MKKMNKNEKMLLLTYLMKDMRGSFPENRKDRRLIRALELMLELSLNNLYNNTIEWIESEEQYGLDGRFFRDCVENYDELSERLETNFIVGPAFMQEIEILEFPEYVVDNFIPGWHDR